MKEYIISVVITAVLISLAELILPQGKLKSIVNTVFSLTLLISMITPLKNADMQIIPTFNQIEIDNKNEELTYVSDYVDGKVAKYYATKYKNVLLENDLVAERVFVEIDNLQIVKVKIFLSNLVIPEENEHINNNVIASYVAQILGIDAKRVEIHA